MTPQTTRPRRPAGDRALRALAWTAVLAPVPYSLSRLLWAAGLPVGVDAELLHDDFHSPGIGSLQILLLVVLCEATALVTHVFLLRDRDRVPAGWPLLGGRAVRPGAVLAVLAAPIFVLGSFNAWSLGAMLDGFVIPPDNGGLPGWSFWGQVAVFWVWGVALTTATALYAWRRLALRAQPA